jgi:hypothetical protein
MAPFDLNYDLRTKGGPLESLPEDYRKEFDAATEALKKQYGGG